MSAQTVRHVMTHFAVRSATYCGHRNVAGRLFGKIALCGIALCEAALQATIEIVQFDQSAKRIEKQKNHDAHFNSDLIFVWSKRTKQGINFALSGRVSLTTMSENSRHTRLSKWL
jgi:hypothetical protein